jgi:glycosyltransferase involved in cell wall biosynthesis
MADQQPKPRISLFFPAYNDEATVERVTEKCVAVLRELASDFEIVIVNDGSPDQSGAIADRMAIRHPAVRAVHHPVNQGYGKAFQTGLREASQFEWVCSLDGDDQYDVRELHQIIRHLPNYDGVQSYRFRKTYGPWRKFISAAYNVFARCLYGTRFRDVNSGLRIFRREVVRDVCVTSASPFAGAEISIKAALKGYRIGEVGISMYPRVRGNSSVVTFRNIMATIDDMLRVRREIFQNQPRDDS